MINKEMFTRESVEKLVDKILLDIDTFDVELVYPIKDVNNREVCVVAKHTNNSCNNNAFIYLMIVTEFTFDGKYYDLGDTLCCWTISDSQSKNELFETINSHLNLLK